MVKFMKVKFSIIAVLITFVFGGEVLAQDACASGRYDRVFFDRLKNNNFVPLERISENSLILMLANCLGDPDPAMRDGIAYEGITAMLRRGRVERSGIRRLLDRCEGYISGEEDEHGYLRPFAALCVAEIARTDRISPHFNDAERSRLVSIGVDYLKSITDYRGFDDQEGWRHGVAHTADLLMQLSLNDNVTADHHKEMLSAIAAKLSPNEHFYTYGEPARLARPVLFMAMQGTIKEEEWRQWFSDIVNPGPEMENWEQAFSSQAGLAKRHNLIAFLSSLHVNAATIENENVKVILPPLMTALQEIP